MTDTTFAAFDRVTDVIGEHGIGTVLRVWPEQMADVRFDTGGGRIMVMPWARLDKQAGGDRW